MNRNEKKETVEGLNQVFQGNDLVIVTHNKGLNAAQTDALRRSTRASGVTCRVAKNRLAQIAIKGTSFEGIADLLKGPTVLLFSKDPVAAAKTAASFAKENPTFIVIGGAMGSTVMDAAGVHTLATLPSLDELRGKLIGIIQAPATKIAGIVQAPAGQLARVVNAYATKG